MSYRVYGLLLDSDEPLPELAAVAEDAGIDDPDVTFRRRDSRRASPDPESWFMHWHLPSGEPWLSAARDATGYVLRFHDLADFVMDRQGRDISCVGTTGDESPETVRHLLIDHVLPLVLNLRGVEALHASAVLTDAGAVVFTGPSGIGKSTLAAEFARAGHAVLADDCVALLEGAHGFEVRPAYPGLRLWPDAHGRLDGCTQLSLAGYTDKYRVSLDAPGEHTLRSSHPLRAVYVLDGEPANESVFSDMPPGEAVMELVARGFRFDVDDRAMLERQLDLFTRVAAEVPVCRLSVPDGLDRLSEVRPAVLECGRG